MGPQVHAELQGRVDNAVVPALAVAGPLGATA